VAKTNKIFYFNSGEISKSQHNSKINNKSADYFRCLIALIAKLQKRRRQLTHVDIVGLFGLVVQGREQSDIIVFKFPFAFLSDR